MYVRSCEHPIHKAICTANVHSYLNHNNYKHQINELMNTFP